MFGIEPLYENAKKGETKDILNKNTLAKDILGWSPIKNLENYIKNLI